MKLRPQTYEGQIVGYCFWCTACLEPHSFRIAYYAAAPNADLWEFNGNLDSPTFTPSLRLKKAGLAPECHVNVTDGIIEYHLDCGHSYAGKKIPLEDFPEGWA
jgi:hypothetical protein